MKYILLVLMALVLSACSSHNSSKQFDRSIPSKDQAEIDSNYYYSLQFVDDNMQFFQNTFAFNDYYDFCIKYTDHRIIGSDEVFHLLRYSCESIIDYESTWR